MGFYLFLLIFIGFDCFVFYDRSFSSPSSSLSLSLAFSSTSPQTMAITLNLIDYNCINTAFECSRVFNVNDQQPCNDDCFNYRNLSQTITGKIFERLQHELTRLININRSPDGRPLFVLSSQLFRNTKYHNDDSASHMIFVYIHPHLHLQFQTTKILTQTLMQQNKHHNNNSNKHKQT